jgi:hypothetical protein
MRDMLQCRPPTVSLQYSSKLGPDQKKCHCEKIQLIEFDHSEVLFLVRSNLRICVLNWTTKRHLRAHIIKSGRRRALEIHV